MIVYATKYGSTAEYAEALARHLGVAAVRADEAMGLTGEEPYYVLGSPIYAFSVLPAMERFVEEQKHRLASRPIAAFVVCGDTLWNPRKGEGGWKNLHKLTRLLPSEPFASAVFGGRMRMEELDAFDAPRILAFYSQIGREPTGFDRMELDRTAEFSEDIRRQLEKLRHPIGESAS